MQAVLIVDDESMLSWPVLANLAPNTAGPRRCRASFCVDRESKLLVARVTGRSQHGRQARATELADIGAVGCTYMTPRSIAGAKYKP